MSRLIDADALKEHLFIGADYDKAIDDGIAKTEEEVFAFQCGWNDALKSVAQFAPTVDAVPVVRCKDCKYRRIKQDWYGNNGEELAQCKQWDAPISDMNGFCSWGERRKDDASN